MSADIHPSFRKSFPGRRRHRRTETFRAIRGFTLVELLVVIAIIATVAAVGLPAIKGFGKSTAVASATKQLLDDVAIARQRALSGRTDVYLVFVPPQNQWGDLAWWNSLAADDRRQATNLLGGQFISYALFAARQVGDQPGRSNPRYLTVWKTLPQGTFIATSKFNYAGPRVNGVSPFETNGSGFPFPSTTSSRKPLPYIGFDYQGRLMTGRDNGAEIVPLARGSIFPTRDANGQLTPQPADVTENPPFNSISNYNHIRIDWLTGRARAERRQIQ